MNNLGAVIGWKFGHRPGMATVAGEITEWPEGEDLPSAEDIAQWTAEYALATGRAAKRAAVDARLAAALDAGMAYGGAVLQIREPDQQNIIAMSQRAGLAAGGAVSWPAEFAWRMADDSYLPLPVPSMMIELATAAANEVYRLRQVAWGHKDALDALESAAAIEAYDIEAGWEAS